MKYSSILAGVFGLMALAACSNSEEVTVEQPKDLHTITVAYGHGADTRFAIEKIYSEEERHPGFKGSWQNGDMISLVSADGTKKYTYSTTDEGQTATFTLVGSEVPADGDYKIVFPYQWDGNLSDYNVQDIWYGSKFDINNYTHALGTATCSNGKFTGEATLTPIFNFLFLWEDLVLENMQYWFSENDLNTDEGLYQATIYLKGDNLYKSIAGYEGSETGGLELNNFTAYYDRDSEVKYWASELDRYIAFPVLPGTTVKNLYLDFDGASCYVMTGDGEYAEFTEGGHVYYLQNAAEDGSTGANLQFPVPK